MVSTIFKEMKIKKIFYLFLELGISSGRMSVDKKFMQTKSPSWLCKCWSVINSILFYYSWFLISWNLLFPVPIACAFYCISSLSCPVTPSKLLFHFFLFLFSLSEPFKCWVAKYGSDTEKEIEEKKIIISLINLI